MNDKLLRTIGMARRAGRLSCGLQDVLDARHAVLYIAAADSGGNVLRNLNRLSEERSVPLITLPHSKEELGKALGFSQCAACAMLDAGLAAQITNASALP